MSSSCTLGSTQAYLESPQLSMILCWRCSCTFSAGMTIKAHVCNILLYLCAGGEAWDKSSDGVQPATSQPLSTLAAPASALRPAASAPAAHLNGKSPDGAAACSGSVQAGREEGAPHASAASMVTEHAEGAAQSKAEVVGANQHASSPLKARPCAETAGPAGSTASAAGASGAFQVSSHAVPALIVL